MASKYNSKLQFYIMALFAFVIPSVSLVAPLAMAPAFIILALYPLWVFVRQGGFKHFWKNSYVNQVMLVFLAYCLISTAWSINPVDTLKLWYKMVLFFMGAVAIFAYARNMENTSAILKSLLAGIILALVIVNIDIITEGFISGLTGIYYRDTHQFDLAMFNRGASVISITSWVAIGYLLNRKKPIYAAILAIAVFITIDRMDSSSATLGYLIAILAFMFIYFTGKTGIKITALCVVLGIAAFATTAKVMDAHKLVGNVPVIEGAASDYRLYIWDYAAEQAYKRPFLGWGLNASRNYPVSATDYVQGNRPPLPLHPHSNILQVWLELGIAGLVIFIGFVLAILQNIARLEQKFAAPLATALFANYFIIGMAGYGMWQNWWLAVLALAVFFMKLATITKTS